MVQCTENGKYVLIWWVIFVYIKTAAETCKLAICRLHEWLPTDGLRFWLGKTNAQCGPITTIRADSMTHFPATTSFFSQQIPLILIFAKCMQPYSLCWDSNAFFPLVSVSLQNADKSQKDSYYTLLSLSTFRDHTLGLLAITIVCVPVCLCVRMPVCVWREADTERKQRDG